jgi:hypothetical protein
VFELPGFDTSAGPVEAEFGGGTEVATTECFESSFFTDSPS